MTEQQYATAMMALARSEGRLDARNRVIPMFGPRYPLHVLYALKIVAYSEVPVLWIDNGPISRATTTMMGFNSVANAKAMLRDVILEHGLIKTQLSKKHGAYVLTLTKDGVSALDEHEWEEDFEE